MIDKFSHPRTAELSVQARRDWLQRLLGSWALVGFWEGGARLVVEIRSGVARPPA